MKDTKVPTSIAKIEIVEESEELLQNEEKSDYMMRFANVGRLYGSSSRLATTESLERLRCANICVIGLGGVGSWVVESLARSGIRRMTLIDMDEVCISNVNRQLCAVSSSIGKFKAEVLKNRVLDINPFANVTVILDFVTGSNVDKILCDKFDYVVDAADGVSDKASIIHHCVVTQTPVVSSGGVGGLVDPSLLVTSDLAVAKGDSLIMRVRKKLRQDFGYRQEKGKNRTKKVKDWQILTVHTSPTGFKRGVADTTQLEEEQSDEVEEISEGDSSKCSLVESSDSMGGSFRQCDTLFGSGTFITGTVGFMLSAIVVNAIARGEPLKPRTLQWMTRKRDFNTSSSSDSGDDNNDIEGNNATTVNKAADFTTQKEELNPEKLDEAVGKGREEVDELEIISPRKEFEFSAEFPLFDAHCHLQLPPLNARAGEVIAQAKKLGVMKTAICATCPGDDWERVSNLHHQHPTFIIPHFGLHPWYIQRYAESLLLSTRKTNNNNNNNNNKEESELPYYCAENLLNLLRVDLTNRLENIIASNSLAGIGECGLDKNIISGGKSKNKNKDDSLGKELKEQQLVDMDMQMEILLIHLEVAAKYRRSVTIHCVSGCWLQLLDAFKIVTSQFGSGCIPSIILHSCHSLPVEMLPSFFSAVGDSYAAKKSVKSNENHKLKSDNFHFAEEDVPHVDGDNNFTRLYFSMSGRLFGSPKGIKLAKAVPLDRLLLETDSPDQIPVPFTGKGTDRKLSYNQPGTLSFTCVEMAKLLNSKCENLSIQTSSNACRAFNTNLDT